MRGLIRQRLQIWSIPQRGIANFQAYFLENVRKRRLCCSSKLHFLARWWLRSIFRRPLKWCKYDLHAENAHLWIFSPSSIDFLHSWIGWRYLAPHPLLLALSFLVIVYIYGCWKILTIGSGFGKKIEKTWKVFSIIWSSVEGHGEALRSDVQRFLLIGSDHLA